MQTYPQLSEDRNPGPCRSFHICRNVTTRTECCIFHICQNVFNSAKCNISQHLSERDTSAPHMSKGLGPNACLRALVKIIPSVVQMFRQHFKMRFNSVFPYRQKSEWSTSVDSLFMLPCIHEENCLCVVRTIWQAHCDPANASHQFRAASGHLRHLDPPHCNTVFFKGQLYYQR